MSFSFGSSSYLNKCTRSFVLPLLLLLPLAAPVSMGVPNVGVNKHVHECICFYRRKRKKERARAKEEREKRDGAEEEVIDREDRGVQQKDVALCNVYHHYSHILLQHHQTFFFVLPIQKVAGFEKLLGVWGRRACVRACMRVRMRVHTSG